MVDMVSQIEAGIIGTLKSATGLAYLKKVESYGGQFDDDLAEVVRAYPAVWVVFAGSGKPKPYDGKKWLVPTTFAVMAAARNVRNEGATRRGSVGEVGTYQILADVRDLLLGQDLGLAIDRFQPGPVRTLFNTRIRGSALSVFSQEFFTAYIAAPPTPAQTELLKVGLNYYLKPGDDIVDASDLRTLR